MIFPGFPGVLSFFQVEWEPCLNDNLQYSLAYNSISSPQNHWQQCRKFRLLQYLYTKPLLHHFWGHELGPVYFIQFSMMLKISPLRRRRLTPLLSLPVWRWGYHYLLGLPQGSWTGSLRALRTVDLNLLSVHRKHSKRYCKWKISTMIFFVKQRTQEVCYYFLPCWQTRSLPTQFVPFHCFNERTVWIIFMRCATKSHSTTRPTIQCPSTPLSVLFIVNKRHF